MKLTIAAIGTRQPAWAQAAIDDYLARLPADFAVTIKELKPEPRQGQPVERIMAAEVERLRAAIPADAVTVALDEHGQDWTTAKLAAQLQRWRDEALPVAFAIGGADGLDAQFKREARLLLRLSSLTLPHALARVLLVEQLYRAWSMLANHPYHRA
ncbi:MAG: 23S rRNA (pseudouridine(1915)-N(3))-methyltransferase RlmH [Burkholderiales bacterium]|jgi:23S rRNA (pseudouridine1915-N3)-methyltransferase|nr:23S rRNA (pseudouridine(1915)-N(3))-methyltransferase RlmH [Burkholderiales bacterium]